MDAPAMNGLGFGGTQQPPREYISPYHNAGTAGSRGKVQQNQTNNNTKLSQTISESQQRLVRELQLVLPKASPIDQGKIREAFEFVKRIGHAAQQGSMSPIQQLNVTEQLRRALGPLLASSEPQQQNMTSSPQAGNTSQQPSQQALLQTAIPQTQWLSLRSHPLLNTQQPCPGPSMAVVQGLQYGQMHNNPSNAMLKPARPYRLMYPDTQDTETGNQQVQSTPKLSFPQQHQDQGLWQSSGRTRTGYPYPSPDWRVQSHHTMYNNSPNSSNTLSPSISSNTLRSTPIASESPKYGGPTSLLSLLRPYNNHSLPSPALAPSVQQPSALTQVSSHSGFRTLASGPHTGVQAPQVISPSPSSTIQKHPTKELSERQTEYPTGSPAVQGCAIQAPEEQSGGAVKAKPGQKRKIPSVVPGQGDEAPNLKRKYTKKAKPSGVASVNNNMSQNSSDMHSAAAPINTSATPVPTVGAEGRPSSIRSQHSGGVHDPAVQTLQPAPAPVPGMESFETPDPTPSASQPTSITYRVGAGSPPAGSSSHGPNSEHISPVTSNQLLSSNTASPAVSRPRPWLSRSETEMSRNDQARGPSSYILPTTFSGVQANTAVGEQHGHPAPPSTAYFNPSSLPVRSSINPSQVSVAGMLNHNDQLPATGQDVPLTSVMYESSDPIIRTASRPASQRLRPTTQSRVRRRPVAAHRDPDVREALTRGVWLPMNENGLSYMPEGYQSVELEEARRREQRAHIHEEEEAARQNRALRFGLLHEEQRREYQRSRWQNDSRLPDPRTIEPTNEFEKMCLEAAIFRTQRHLSTVTNGECPRSFLNRNRSYNVQWNALQEEYAVWSREQHPFYDGPIMQLLRLDRWPGGIPGHHNAPNSGLLPWEEPVPSELLRFCA